MLEEARRPLARRIRRGPARDAPSCDAFDLGDERVERGCGLGPGDGPGRVGDGQALPVPVGGPRLVPTAARSVRQPPRRTSDAEPAPAIDPVSGRSTIADRMPRSVVVRAVTATRVGRRRRACGRSRGTRGCRRPGSAALGAGDGAEGQHRDEQEPERTIPHGRRYVPWVSRGLDGTACSHGQCGRGNPAGV